MYRRKEWIWGLRQASISLGFHKPSSSYQPIPKHETFNAIPYTMSFSPLFHARVVYDIHSPLQMIALALPYLQCPIVVLPRQSSSSSVYPSRPHHIISTNLPSSSISSVFFMLDFHGWRSLDGLESCVQSLLHEVQIICPFSSSKWKRGNGWKNKEWNDIATNL